MIKNQIDYKIGETFQFGFKKLEVIESDRNRCAKCALFDLCRNIDYKYLHSLFDIIGHCNSFDRNDGKNIHFKEVKE